MCEEKVLGIIKELNEIVIPISFHEKLNAYLLHVCFDNERLIPENPYQRPIRRQDLVEIDFTQPIKRSEIFTNKNLLIHKILNTIYEQDLLFLDKTFNTDQGYQDFQNFYAPEFVALGKEIKPTLEYLAFHFLDKNIEVIGHWTKAKFTEYLAQMINEYESQSSALCQAVKDSANSTLAAKTMLIQMAPDFLTEASAMGRALLGSFGPEQSELMKVFIDEYGYGVHDTKHSTLFEKTLSSTGLSYQAHYYYNDYLPTSLMLGNYFHYLCSNRGNCFKHIGALYYSEAVIPHFNRQVSKTLRSVLPEVDTTYFDEHVHIDTHHHRMVLEKIILPSIDKYGEEIIDDILLGLESFRMLLGLADNDLIAQIQFIDQLNRREKSALADYKKLGNVRSFIEVKDEITSAHLHGETEFFSVNDGSLFFYASPLCPVILREGRSIVIPKGRLHSTVIQSDTASYSVQSIEPSNEGKIV